MMLSIKLYEDLASKRINVDLFSEKAEGLSKEIAQDRKTKTSNSQVRKFYDEIVHYRDIVRSDKNTFNAVLPLVRMLSAKVVYANARKKVSDEFRDMIKDLVIQINEVDDLEIATTFFEAFVGYYKAYGPK